MTKPKSKIIQIITRIAVFAIISFFIGISIYNANAKNVMGDKLPMPLGVGSAIVLSGSMEPELSVNDLIIVRKTTEFYKKQVVVYQNGGSLVVHRIESINGEEIITKGDANNTADAPILRSDIKGEVVFVIPYMGVVVEVLQSPLMIILLLGLAIFLIARSYRKDKNSNDELDEIKKEIEKLSEQIKK